MNELALYGGPPMRERPFSPWPVFDQAERDALSNVLESRRWGGLYGGSHAERFETELAAYLDLPHALTVSSGTAGLMIALKALDVRPGDEVVVPAMTYVATATAVSLIGGIPVFVDVDPDTHTISASDTAAAITMRTRAIVAVHLGGHPSNMDNLVEVTGTIPIIEDCAQSLGAEWRNAMTGTHGTVGVFSFASTKNITAGEGGAVVTRDESLAKRIAALRDHGRPPSSKEHRDLGWNFRLSEFQSAVLRAQLARVEHQLAVKTEGAAFLASRLSQVPGLTPVPAVHDERVTAHAWFSLAFVFDGEEFGTEDAGSVSLATFRAAIRAEGIPVVARDVIACPDEPIYADGTLPNHAVSRTASATQARIACSRLILLGQVAGSGLLLDPPEDLKDVVHAVTKIHKNRRCLLDEPDQLTPA